MTGVLEPWDKDFVSDINVFNVLADIIRSLASTESCIIIGKCADDILRDRKNVISLYIEAPRQACIKSICEKMHVSPERAAKLITSTDKYRSNHYSYYTGGKKWTNPTNYDMVLNSDRVGRDKCVEIVKNYIQLKFGIVL